MKLVQIDGIIDDYAPTVEFNGKPVVRSADVAQDSLVLVCSSVRPRTARENLKAAGFANVLDYPLFFKHSRHPGLKMLILDNFEEEFRSNRNKFEWVFDQLADEDSRDVFRRLVNYRLTGDLGWMSCFDLLPQEQYFPEFLPLAEDVFVDIGGFDGATSLEFIRRCPDYRGVYFFEPSPDNFERAKLKLSKMPMVHCMNMGLSDRAEALRFNPHGSRSAFTASGEIVVPVDALDKAVPGPVTFIKLDCFEAGESKILEGSRGHIMNEHPKIDVVVYHKSDELWSIPEQVLRIRDDYDVYLRHYTEGVFESVMYFKPR